MWHSHIYYTTVDSVYRVRLVKVKLGHCSVVRFGDYIPLHEKLGVRRSRVVGVSARRSNSERSISPLDSEDPRDVCVLREAEKFDSGKLRTLRKVM